jgi:hypothetical protein
MLRRAARVARFTLKNLRIAVRADRCDGSWRGCRRTRHCMGWGAQGRAEGRLPAQVLT